MSYDSTRDDEQLKMLDNAISTFIADYKKRSLTVDASRRRTIFLFPGGLASKLMRATTPYDDTSSAPQSFDYEICWATADTLLNGKAVLLAMQKVAPDVYLDSDKRIIVADGAVDLDAVLDLPDSDKLPGVSPYTGFTLWCDFKGYDCFVYGWDWRRRLQDCGKFFVDRFLPHFQARMKAECGVDPPDPFSLVGHSAGAMVVNWILRNMPDTPQLRRVVTVGGPFYGYAGQLHRWFEGDPLVNGVQGQFKDAIVRTVCKLPACYAWNYAGAGVYTPNAAAFAADPEFPLQAYPCTDAVTANLVADPYDPKTQVVGGNTLTRYLTDVGFDPDELDDAAELVQQLAGPLTPVQANKFYNLRGVKTQAGTGGILGAVGDLLGGLLGAPANNALVELNTTGSSRWNWVPGATPTITDGPPVPGDGVQPAWTARHLGLVGLAGHVITAKGPDAEHAGLMSAPSVLGKLDDVLDF